MPSRTKIRDSRRITIASKQRFRCANFIDPSRVPGYECPFTRDGGSFDESCFDIDHIIERCRGGSDDDSNLQALCLCCHGVKTRRFNMSNASRVATNEEDDEEQEEEEETENEDYELIEKSTPKRSPKRLGEVLVEGQTVYIDYLGERYSAKYSSETNTLDTENEKFTSPSAFRRWVVKGDSSYSGKGWETSYVINENGNRVLLKDL